MLSPVPYMYIFPINYIDTHNENFDFDPEIENKLDPKSNFIQQKCLR